MAFKTPAELEQFLDTAQTSDVNILDFETVDTNSYLVNGVYILQFVKAEEATHEAMLAVVVAKIVAFKPANQNDPELNLVKEGDGVGLSVFRRAFSIGVFRIMCQQLGIIEEGSEEVTLRSAMQELLAEFGEGSDRAAEVVITRGKEREDGEGWNFKFKNWRAISAS